jgi:hypothetical protein
VLRGPPSADDANGIFIALGPNYEDETTCDGADGDEAILHVGVNVVEDLEVVDPRGKELLGFLERDTMFASVGEVLGFLPRNLHEASVSHWLTIVKRASRRGRKSLGAGNPNAAKADGHMEIAHRTEQPSMSRDELRELVSREGILGSEGLANAVQVLGGDGHIASGFDLTDHNGSIYGGEGEGKGNFGGGLFGGDLGGGCLGGPCGTIGTRPGYGKIGIGLPHGGFGPPGIGFPPGRNHQALVPGDQPTISNPRPGYDKAIVRRYIHRHLNEISYCYEKQLLAHPNLGGEIKVEFLIGATGTVQSASGSGFDGEVASCLAGVVKTIEFPSPGDAIQVSYPFHFHAPGQ